MKKKGCLIAIAAFLLLCWIAGGDDEEESSTPSRTETTTLNDDNEMVKTCVRCGSSFVTSDHSQNVCSSCRNALNSGGGIRPDKNEVERRQSQGELMNW